MFTGSHSDDVVGQKKKSVVREAVGNDVLMDTSLPPIDNVKSDTRAHESNKIRHSKMQCHFCFQTFGRRYLKHIESCQRYSKLLVNGTTCSICNKSFDFIRDAYRHIG